MLTKKEGEKEKCKERLIGRKEKNQRPRANVSQISVNGSIYVIGIRGNEGGGEGLERDTEERALTNGHNQVSSLVERSGYVDLAYRRGVTDWFTDLLSRTRRCSKASSLVSCPGTRSHPPFSLPSPFLGDVSLIFLRFRSVCQGFAPLISQSLRPTPCK